MFVSLIQTAPSAKSIGKLFSNLTLRSIEEADPNGATGSKEISLRSLYKRLINVAGVYYYVSLPVVIFLVLGVAGSILYSFFIIGRIPIKLALIVAVAAAVTVYKMIRSLFVKIESEDPGRALKPEEAPGLWALTREVAQAVGTRLQVSPEAFDQQMIETKIKDIITRPTTEDDTHPSPIDRFRLAQRIVCNNPPSSNAMVWDLFASRESLTDEMSKLIDDRVKEAATA